MGNGLKCLECGKISIDAQWTTACFDCGNKDNDKFVNIPNDELILEKYGKVWTSEEADKEFECLSFLNWWSMCYTARERSSNKIGRLHFTNDQQCYYNFEQVDLDTKNIECKCCRPFTDKNDIVILGIFDLMHNPPTVKCKCQICHSRFKSAVKIIKVI